MNAPKICTERLTLRHFEPEDTAMVAKIWGDRETGKYMADRYYDSAEELAADLGDISESPVYYFVASVTGTDEVMGTCSIGPENDKSDKWSVGYTVRKDHWGNGYAVEMVNALITFARGLNIRVLYSPVAQANAASNRVMQKCGFVVDSESSFRKYGTDVVFPSYIYRFDINE